MEAPAAVEPAPQPEASLDPDSPETDDRYIKLGRERNRRARLHAIRTQETASEAAAAEPVVETPEEPVAPEPVVEHSGQWINGTVAVMPPEPAQEAFAAAPPVVRGMNRRARRAERRRSVSFPAGPEPSVQELPETEDVDVEAVPNAFAAGGAAPALEARVEEAPAVVAAPITVEAPVQDLAPPQPANKPAVAAAPAAEKAAPEVVPAVEEAETESEINRECPACGDSHTRLLFQATDRLYRTTGKVFQILECKQCRLIRLEPRPTRKESATYYPERYWFSPAGGLGRLEEAYRRLVLRDHISFVRQALASSDGDGYLVDVGCGNGLLLSLLPHQKILGLDLSSKALSIAWKQNGVPGACADLSEVPLRRGSCSVVTMFHIIEHLSNPVRYLEAARDLLTPRGRLVVQVPNASCWQFMLFGQNWNGIDVPRHLFNYRQRDLENLLTYCGFEVTRRKHFSLRDNPAGMASSLAPGLDPMARRVRRLKENRFMRWIKDAVYFGLVLGALPFTAIEAACGCGSTIMLEARKKV